MTCGYWGNTINLQSTIHNRKFIFWLLFILVTLIAFFFRFYQLAGHPLGLFFDPAINGLDALRLMQRGGSVLFFPTNGGREALLIYLLIPFIWFFGPTPFAFRLQLAIISLLNVVCLFPFLHHLRFTHKGPLAPIYDLPARGLWLRFTNKNTSAHHSPFTIHHSQFTIWLATLAALTLAVSPWHIAISRGDQRPLAVPLLAVLVFWFFLKGWTTHRSRWFLLSGLFLGLSFHTYSAARLIPVILLLAILPECFLRSRAEPSLGMLHAVRFTRPTLLLILPALLVAVPILWYFFNHPAQFSGRAASVMVWAYLDTPAAILAELGRNLIRVLSFFCCAGSPNAIFGLPGTPGLSPLLTPFLVIGLISAFKHWRDLFSRLVALWWLIGLAPSILAIEAPHPLRMIVALPATAILVALGLINFSTWLTLRLRMQPPLGMPSALRSTLLVLPFLLILTTIPAMFFAYFIEWPKLPVTQGIYDYGAVAIRDVVFEYAADARPIYLPLARFNDQPLLFYLSGRFKREAALTATPASQTLVIAPEKNERDTVWVRLRGQTATILPPLTFEGQQLIQTALAGDSTQAIQTNRGETVARLAPLPADPVRFAQQPTRPLTATFGPVRLIGATYAAAIDPISGELAVTLYWQALGQMVEDYEVILQLVDDNRRVWGDGSARPNDWVYPTTFWQPGLDTIAAQQIVKLNSASLSPGRYWLAVAFFNPPIGQRLPLTEGSSDSPDTFFIGPLKVPLSPPLPLPPLQGGSVTFGNVAKLTGFKPDPHPVAVGDPVRFTLLWEALTTPELDYTVFVHLLDAHDNIIAGSDTQPLNNTYPTTIWSPGEQILDDHILPTPASLPPGQYRLAIGLYHQPTGQRLPLHFPNGREDTTGRLILNPTVTITNAP